MKSRTSVDVVVVGGGAAGILAAYASASSGARTVLLEKKDRLGMKIRISGGGRCNVTHQGPIEELLRAFRREEARFLRPAFYRFTNDDILTLLEGSGLRFAARPDGRVFPSAGSAADVVAALQSLLDDAGATVHLDAKVEGLEFNDPSQAPSSPSSAAEHENMPESRQKSEAPQKQVIGVRLAGRWFSARHVIVAAGGCSFPGTGTTGDGWPWLRDAGHTIVKIRAALAPLFLQSAIPARAGLALRDVALKARQGVSSGSDKGVGSGSRNGGGNGGGQEGGQSGKTFVSWRGDLLFTHRGLSGPCALGISREVAERRPFGPVQVEVDLCPDRRPEELSANFQQWLKANPRRLIAGYLEDLLGARFPERLIPEFLLAVSVALESRSSQLTQKDRNSILRGLKGWLLGEVQHVPLEKGEVVAGGVALDEVDPHTMQSRRVQGLYLCGEILDIAGPVGGYNLQAAWSTGVVAGETAARQVNLEGCNRQLTCSSAEAGANDGARLR